MNEEWRDIPGYVGYYQVSDRGKVRSLDRIVERGNGTLSIKGQLKAARTLPTGHHQVKLYKGNIEDTRYVHELVAVSFFGRRPIKHEIHHINGKPNDNRIENLTYITRQQHAKTFNWDNLQRGEQHFRAKLDNSKVRNIRELHRNGIISITEIARKYDVHYSTIENVVKGKAWVHVT